MGAREVGDIAQLMVAVLGTIALGVATGLSWVVGRNPDSGGYAAGFVVVLASLLW